MNFLIIQTAFIGDVILATAVVEKIHHVYPASKIDFLLRKGNEGLLRNHPFIHEIIVWDKRNSKVQSLTQITQKVRANKYEYVINLHRFASSGIITAFSGAKHRFGFDKNPFSFAFTKSIHHEIGNSKHEVERNLELIKDITDEKVQKPKLYPSEKDFKAVENYKADNYYCVAPTSVWFTKQFPKEKWIETINHFPKEITVYLLGATSDFPVCEDIQKLSLHPKVINLSGRLSFLESAALMRDAKMNYVNDSAPLHIASAMNAPVTAVFCSTVPAFGFGPLSDRSKIIETKEKLKCRPCGIHGHKACPEGHFRCATTVNIIDEDQVVDIVSIESDSRK